MKSLAAMLALITLLATAPAANAQKADPAVFGALPDVIDVAVSPDGNTIAAMQNIGGANALIFYDISGDGNEPIGVGLGDADPRRLEWANNDRVLVMVSQSERTTTTSGITSIEFFR